MWSSASSLNVPVTGLRKAVTNRYWRDFLSPRRFATAFPLYCAVATAIFDQMRNGDAAPHAETDSSQPCRLPRSVLLDPNHTTLS